MHIDDIAYRLWHDCIRPAARYDRWLPSPANADHNGHTTVMTTPVLAIAGHKCVLAYWHDGLETEVWWVALAPEAGGKRDVARIYVFGDAWPDHAEQHCEDVTFEWELHDEGLYDDTLYPHPIILACSWELPDQLEMGF